MSFVFIDHQRALWIKTATVPQQPRDSCDVRARGLPIPAVRFRRLKIQRSFSVSARPGCGICGSIPAASIFIRISHATFQILLPNWRAELRRSSL